jgi:hypothetical protein
VQPTLLDKIVEFVAVENRTPFSVMPDLPAAFKIGVFVLVVGFGLVSEFGNLRRGEVEDIFVLRHIDAVDDGEFHATPLCEVDPQNWALG